MQQKALYNLSAASVQWDVQMSLMIKLSAYTHEEFQDGPIHSTVTLLARFLGQST